MLESMEIQKVYDFLNMLQVYVQKGNMTSVRDS
jgi:hypothetical protein